MIDLTRWIVTIGYFAVAVAAWWIAGRCHSPTRRVAAVLIATFSTAWSVFYLWVSAIDLADTTQRTAATLGSRLAHLPTIAAATVLLILMLDEERHAKRAASNLLRGADE